PCTYSVVPYTTLFRSNKAPDVMSGAYRAVWRWHFYAGVLVMPFLLLLTLTGGLYLFKDEIDHAVYRSMIEVPVSAQQADPDQWLDRKSTRLNSSHVKI